jgi:peptidylprolyl isomerase
VQSTCASNEKAFVFLQNGLKYIEINPGSGPKPNPGDTVKVHYTGWLDGFDGQEKFDSSVDRGYPLDFPVLVFLFACSCLH